MPLRYDRVAAAVHWITAALLLAQIAVGFIFHAMERGAVRTEWFTWHKSLGLSILGLALVRLAWRWTHTPPPLPAEMPRWEQRVAIWSHRAFYVLLIALPLTGLIAVSAYTNQPAIELAGGVTLPPIPAVPEDAGATAEEVHKNLVQMTIALLALHLLAAIKHRFLSRSQMRLPSRMALFGGADRSAPHDAS